MTASDPQKRLDSIRHDLTRTVENLVLLEVTESTQALARELIEELDQEEKRLAATVIISDRQNHGEARSGRSWISPPGGLYLTWLQSGLGSATILRLPMLAAVAAHGAVTEVGVEGARIKWPNDLLVTGRKLAGILVFARHGNPSWASVGLGVNVESTPSIDDHGALPAISVAELVSTPDPGTWRDRIASSFVNRLVASLPDPEPALATWHQLLLQQPGEPVNVALASGEVVSGTLLEVLPEGHLRLRTDDGERTVSGGDIIET